MAKISKLTAKQEKELKDFRARMWRQGVSCEPWDRVTAEAAITAAYKEIGMPPPTFFWMPSPWSCAMGLSILRYLTNNRTAGAGLQAGLKAGLGDGLWAGLEDGLEAGLEARLEAGLRHGLRHGLEDGIRDGLADGIRAGLRDGLEAGIRDGLGKIFTNEYTTLWWGQMDTYWLSFYRFGTDLGCEQTSLNLRRLEIMESISASCGFWYPRDKVCFVSDRFLDVKWDNARNHVGLPFRLHCDDGPAVTFRDGWSLYYWHGIRIPFTHRWIITDKSKITADAIMNEPNAELRRIMCEASEFKPIISIANIIATDRDGNGLTRRLMTASIKGAEIRLIEVQNGSLEPDGSRRKFVIGAMPGDTPHAAIAASYGINPAYYREAVRT